MRKKKQTTAECCRAVGQYLQKTERREQLLTVKTVPGEEGRGARRRRNDEDGGRREAGKRWECGVVEGWEAQEEEGGGGGRLPLLSPIQIPVIVGRRGQQPAVGVPAPFLFLLSQPFPVCMFAVRGRAAAARCLQHGNQVPVQPPQSPRSAGQDVHVRFPRHHPGRPGELRRVLARCCADASVRSHE